MAFLEGSEQPLAISVITVAELYAGVRDGEERQQLDAFIGAFTVLPWIASRPSAPGSGAASTDPATAPALPMP